MLSINVRTNIEEFSRDMGTLQQRQLPFVRDQAINATAADVAQAVRNTMQQKFRTSPQGLRFLHLHVRVIAPGSMMGRINLPTGAGAEGRGYVGVVPPEGKGQFYGWQRYRGSLVPMLEGGGLTPGPRPFGGVMGLGRYWIPERTATDRTAMPLSMFPINLSLQARQSIEGKRIPGQLRGKRRTFLIKGREGHGTIFQRFGRDRGAVTPLFFTHPQAKLPARHYFFPTAVRIVTTRFDVHLRRAMDHALFARGTYRG